MTETIKVDGLQQFTRDLKKLDAELPKAVRLANNEAADIVVGDARGKIPSRSGRARSTVKAKSTRLLVRVAGGGRKAPYYPWLDFGGSVGRRKRTTRPFLKDGRYIYRSYFRKRDSGEFGEVLSRALIKVAEQAGIEVE